ncbi:MAG: Unknown protein [uncultured Sulfurovum sp.]|uniref:Polysaccharide biosynthesis protein C-terminal domain-containing protein n=1 Tax=uncultured Sulfurovum sp. TaxID=269237 RepID=A0A6S6T494_9BACT|nr:MAG: Unknown protein [uncultured Sulfurovum sp.]
MFTKINIKYYYSISYLFYNFSYFIFLFIVSKFLSLTQWGEISLLLLIALYSNILTLGVSNGFSINLPYNIAKDDKYKIEALYSIIWISILYIVFIYFILSFLLDKFYIKNHIILFSLYLISNYILLIMRIIARSYNDYKTLGLAYLFQAIILFFIILNFIYFDFKNVFLSLSLSNIIAIVILTITHKYKFLIKIHYNPKVFIELIMIGMPLLIAGILYSLLLGVDRFLIKEYYGIEDVGIYAFASLFFKINMVLITLVNTIFYPRIIKSYAKNNFDEIIKLSKLQQWYSSLLVVISSIFIFLIIKFYLFDLFPKFSSASSIIFIFLITTVIYPFSLYTTYLTASGNQKKYMYIMFISFIINILLNIYFLSNAYPLYFVAYSTFFSILFNVIAIRFSTIHLFKHKGHV